MLDREEELELQEEIKRCELEYLNDIKVRIKELYKIAVDEKIYQYYSPTTYVRTYDYLNSVDVKLDSRNNSLFVFADLNEGMGHNSVVTGEDESANINNWIINGHDDGIGIKKQGYNQYHRYEGRDEVLTYAQELIQREFPDLKVQIINDNKGYDDISEYL